jgi:hypothetical protein
MGYYRQCKKAAFWRAKIVWANGAVHYFGKFTSEKKATPPTLFGLALHCWSGRVLDLEPMPRMAREIAGPWPLRHDAFTAELAGVLKEDVAVPFEKLGQDNSRMRAAPSA